ncbi:hypothetical protein EIN_281990 [Entamoeba invadens IP1]|uniref:Uncharacterized protein n=1 Tax=Entamoeba invadens IP1 TaxID=370355 RepID=A0A0A1TX39_ENTIV|nr:hypothetical protein EIN_281990 [Entamoeba invadens IP1]ELP85828.1 hypothetical protein EIN_281990 [Entamoeba invadens IP1]|eukprot:XP_004185174.1 hypothetical protein EIN_281990 [Entamoeba invadens IP1]
MTNELQTSQFLTTKGPVLSSICHVLLNPLDQNVVTNADVLLGYILAQNSFDGFVDFCLRHDFEYGYSSLSDSEFFLPIFNSFSTRYLGNLVNLISKTVIEIVQDEKFYIDVPTLYSHDTTSSLFLRSIDSLVHMSSIVHTIILSHIEYLEPLLVFMNVIPNTSEDVEPRFVKDLVYFVVSSSLKERSELCRMFNAENSLETSTRLEFISGVFLEMWNPSQGFLQEFTLPCVLPEFGERLIVGLLCVEKKSTFVEESEELGFIELLQKYYCSIALLLSTQTANTLAKAIGMDKFYVKECVLMGKKLHYEIDMITCSKNSELFTKIQEFDTTKKNCIDSKKNQEDLYEKWCETRRSNTKLKQIKFSNLEIQSQSSRENSLKSEGVDSNSEKISFKYTPSRNSLKADWMSPKHPESPKNSKLIINEKPMLELKPNRNSPVKTSSAISLTTELPRKKKRKRSFVEAISCLATFGPKKD